MAHDIRISEAVDRNSCGAVLVATSQIRAIDDPRRWRLVGLTTSATGRKKTNKHNEAGDTHIYFRHRVLPACFPSRREELRIAYADDGSLVDEQTGIQVLTPRAQARASSRRPSLANATRATSVVNRAKCTGGPRSTSKSGVGRGEGAFPSVYTYPCLT